MQSQQSASEMESQKVQQALAIQKELSDMKARNDADLLILGNLSYSVAKMRRRQETVYLERTKQHEANADAEDNKYNLIFLNKWTN